MSLLLVSFIALNVIKKKFSLTLYDWVVMAERKQAPNEGEISEYYTSFLLIVASL